MTDNIKPSLVTAPTSAMMNMVNQQGLNWLTDHVNNSSILPVIHKIYDMDQASMAHEAFEKGADGVYAVGCMEGDCHYTSGNFRARKRIEQAKKILDTVGVGGERVEMFNMASSEGPMFAEVADAGARS